jgi:hypothetical protein
VRLAMDGRVGKSNQGTAERVRFPPCATNWTSFFCFIFFVRIVLNSSLLDENISAQIEKFSLTKKVFSAVSP